MGGRGGGRRGGDDCGGADRGCGVSRLAATRHGEGPWGWCGGRGSMAVILARECGRARGTRGRPLASSRVDPVTPRASSSHRPTRLPAGLSSVCAPVCYPKRRTTGGSAADMGGRRPPPPPPPPFLHLSVCSEGARRGRVCHPPPAHTLRVCSRRTGPRPPVCAPLFLFFGCAWTAGSFSWSRRDPFRGGRRGTLWARTPHFAAGCAAPLAVQQNATGGGDPVPNKTFLCAASGRQDSGWSALMATELCVRRGVENVVGAPKWAPVSAQLGDTSGLWRGGRRTTPPPPLPISAHPRCARTTPTASHAARRSRWTRRVEEEEER
jgi:hypothetical protein